MIVEDEIIGSHTEDESHDNEHDDMSNVLELFGIEKEEEQQTKESDPPTDQKTEEKEEKKGITVKYNKEDTFIEEERVPELARKGLNYDKVEGRANEYQAALDRVAKLQGFNSHADLIDNLDRIEQEKQQAQKDQIEQMKQKVIDDLVYNGVDEEVAKDYAENNPLVQAARAALKEKERLDAELQVKSFHESVKSQWDEVYREFPELDKREILFDGNQVILAGDEAPEWFTPEMADRLSKGYSPLDAFKLAHGKTLAQKTSKAAEQRLIKEQQLGLRSKVETNSPADNEPAVPAELANAFAAFGLPADAAKKYVK